MIPSRAAFVLMLIGPLACGEPLPPQTPAPGTEAPRAEIVPAGAPAVALNEPQVQLAMGDHHACHLRADGALWCWGDNSNGQIGDGTRDVRARPLRIDVPGAAALAMTGSASCALRSDGTVWCWGAHLPSWSGDRLRPEPLRGVSDAVAVSLAWDQLCVLDARGALRCTSRRRLNAEEGAAVGELFDMPVVQGVRAIDGRNLMTCARGDALWCWNDHPMPVADAGVGGAFAAGFRGGCHGDAEGSLTCWGMGDEPETKRPRRMELPPVQHVDASGSHACAAAVDGSVWCWGEGASGELGHGRFERQQPVPQRVEDVRGAVEVAVGYGTSCALAGDGAVSCWGDGSYGTTGQGTQGRFTLPVRLVDAPEMQDVVMTMSETCGLARDGRLWCWGGGDADEVPQAATLRLQKLPAAPGEDPAAEVRQVLANPDELCALTKDGRLYCRASRGLERQTLTDWQIVASGVSAIGLGPEPVHTGGVWYAIHQKGALSRWWTDFDNGTRSLHRIEGVSDVVAASGVLGLGCAAHRDGRLSCWPDDLEVVGPSRLRAHPILVPGVSDVVLLSGACLQLADGRAGCLSVDSSWHQRSEARRPPQLTLFSGDPTESLVSYGDALCVVSKDGGALCRAPNGPGSNALDRVRNFERARRIAWARGSACVVNDRAEVWCVGDNDTGRLGQRDEVVALRPLPVRFDAPP